MANFRDYVKKNFVNLVNTYGSQNELETWGYCSEYGCELAGSTIDKIKVYGSDVLFYFNENSGDCDTFEEFTLKALKEFYNSLLKAIKEEQEYQLSENAGEVNSARHDLQY